MLIQPDLHTTVLRTKINSHYCTLIYTLLMYMLVTYGNKYLSMYLKQYLTKICDTYL